MTVGVVEVGVVSQPGADAERYRCACLHCTQGLAGRGDGYQCGLDWGLSSRLQLPQPRSSRFSDVTVICGHSMISMLCGNTEYCVKISDEDLSGYWKKIESDGLRKCPYITVLRTK